MMRAAHLLAPGTLEMRDVPVPVPAPGEVLVKVEVALTCGTDLKLYRRGHARLKLPSPFGHEFAGVIAATGAGVTAFAIGDRIACVPTAPCGVCRLCRGGRENLCADAVGRMVLGAYAEYVLLPAHIVALHLFHRPHDMSAATAAALEPLSCVVHGANRIDWSRHGDVVIIGDGAIALLFVRLALLRGAARVLLLGRHAERLAVARSYGADVVDAVDDDSARHAVMSYAPDGVSQIIECVGTPETWRLASELASPGGSVLLFGGCAPGAQATFAAARLHYDEVDLTGAFHYTPAAVREAWRMLCAGEIDIAPLVTHHVPLDRLRDALDLIDTRAAIRVAVTP